MGLRDGEIHVMSLFGTAVLTGALFVPVVYFTEAVAAQKSDFGDMEAIEASVAYRKTPIKQPQKPTQNPDVKKPEGVSHDETKKPVDGCKTDADCKHAGETCEPKTGRCVDKRDKVVVKVDAKDPFKDFKHTTDDDSQSGKPVTQPGDFNGSEFGWASETKGDPYWQRLVTDFRQGWEIPSILDVKGAPVGCFHIAPDGKIADTKFKEKSGDDALDDSVQRALDTLKKLRNDKPEPVPTELLGATNRWVCFRFNPNKG